MAGVGVVTDSTSSLDPATAARAGVQVVPLQVVIDGLSRAEDSAGVSGRAVAVALRSGGAVSTSRPTPEAFAHAYEAVVRDGAEAIVSVHLSGRISGTADAARRAARGAGVPVVVVDTESVAMAVGFGALAGATAAAAGQTADQVAEVVRRCVARSATWFCVDSLEHLRRGGRIGAARALLGSALAIKPVLTVRDGVIQPYERVRTTAKARARLVDLAITAAEELRSESQPARVAVQHVDDPGPARQLAEQINARARHLDEVTICELSAVLGVHVGPGTLGVAVAPGEA